MTVRLKPLGEQVVVITGASSGIGLATAEMAAKRGARVVLSSRDEADLRTAGERIRAEGGRAAWFAADVADLEAMRGLAQLALTEFGAIDTWVNNAGVSIVGRLEAVSVEDARRLFETNSWGVVHGSLVALPHLEAGGALINIGSILSDTGYPLQGHYTASKHAVKGFTDSLRLEVEESGRPISVTLIQPAAIDTLYPEHAKSYLGVEPKHMPPVYAPEVVAKAILHCAEHPERDVLVGGGAKVFALTEQVTPRLGDRLKEAAYFRGQHSDVPDRDTDTLHAPRPGDGRVRGNYSGRVFERSAYTAARLHRNRTLLGIAVIGAGLMLAARRD
jgi:NAD(P)-dependent dehydrogenase (short-subunit alcohol dehydrogenase family)